MRLTVLDDVTWDGVAVSHGRLVDEVRGIDALVPARFHATFGGLQACSGRARPLAPQIDDATAPA